MTKSVRRLEGSIFGDTGIAPSRDCWRLLNSPPSRLFRAYGIKKIYPFAITAFINGSNYLEIQSLSMNFETLSINPDYNLAAYLLQFPYVSPFRLSFQSMIIWSFQPHILVWYFCTRRNKENTTGKGCPRKRNTFEWSLTRPTNFQLRHRGGPGKSECSLLKTTNATV